MDWFNCSFCNYRTQICSLLMKHYNEYHLKQANFTVSCGIDGCPSSYDSVTWLHKHIYTKHNHIIRNDKRLLDQFKKQEIKSVENIVASKNDGETSDNTRVYEGSLAPNDKITIQYLEEASGMRNSFNHEQLNETNVSSEALKTTMKLSPNVQADQSIKVVIPQCVVATSPVKASENYNAVQIRPLLHSTIGFQNQNISLSTSNEGHKTSHVVASRKSSHSNISTPILVNTSSFPTLHGEVNGGGNLTQKSPFTSIETNLTVNDAALPATPGNSQLTVTPLPFTSTLKNLQAEESSSVYKELLVNLQKSIDECISQSREFINRNCLDLRIRDVNGIMAPFVSLRQSLYDIDKVRNSPDGASHFDSETMTPIKIETQEDLLHVEDPLSVSLEDLGVLVEPNLQEDSDEDSHTYNDIGYIPPELHSNWPEVFHIPEHKFSNSLLTILNHDAVIGPQQQKELIDVIYDAVTAHTM